MITAPASHTMDTEILDGKGLSQKIKEEIAIEVTDWVAQGHRRPHLAAVWEYWV